MRVTNYSADNHINLPVSGGGSDIKLGALLMRGTTPGTNNGTLVLASGAGANCVGILQEKHVYATVGDTTIDGLAFVKHPVDIIVPGRLVRVEYSLASGDSLACTQAVNSTAMTLTSLEDNIDASFLYVSVGTGIGQTNFLTASAAGSCTLKAAFGTSLDVTSKIVKILPRFHRYAVLTSDGTKLATTDAVGTFLVHVLDSYIVRDNHEDQLDPTKHSALTGLNGYTSLRFEALVAIRKAFAYNTD